MKKFLVVVEENTVSKFEIEARDAYDAKRKAEALWLRLVSIAKDKRLVEFSVPEREVWIYSTPVTPTPEAA